MQTSQFALVMSCCHFAARRENMDRSARSDEYLDARFEHEAKTAPLHCHTTINPFSHSGNYTCHVPYLSETTRFEAITAVMMAKSLDILTLNNGATTIFRKVGNDLKRYIAEDLNLQLLPETFLLLRRIQRDIIINVQGYYKRNTLSTLCNIKTVSVVTSCVVS